MKKPSSVQLFLVIEWLRLLGYLFIIIGVSVAPALTGLSPTLDQALQGLALGLGFQDIRQIGQEHSHILGYFIGFLGVPALFVSVGLLGVRIRRLWLCRTGVVITLLLILGQVSLGNLPHGWGVDLVALLVTFRRSFKRYFTQE